MKNICLKAPKDWIIEHKKIPKDLPLLVEDADKIVKKIDITGSWDLVLFMGESASAFSLLPTILEKIDSTSIIAPVDDYSWLPLGLERQIESKLDEKGVVSVFPRPFCSLTSVNENNIDNFVKFFGLPSLKIEVEDNTIKHVDVIRSAPCGSTFFMAKMLPGTKINDGKSRAATLVQIFPCLASRKIDRFFSDSPIHIAGHIISNAVERALCCVKSEKNKN